MTTAGARTAALEQLKDAGKEEAVLHELCATLAGTPAAAVDVRGAAVEGRAPGPEGPRQVLHDS